MPATPFLGREQELAEVSDLLAQGDVRLLTLTGPGGTGKTRIALQAAAAADVFPDGVYWVPLAPLRDPELVLQGAAQAIGAEDGLADHIADKRLLLLLDNFEHLVDAATDAGALLGSCPNLRLLVTSREPLHVRGEQEYLVPPLIEREGIELFAARARAIDPEFVPGADGARDLPPSRRPPAGPRARSRAHQGTLPHPDPRASRTATATPHRRCQRPPRAAAHASRHDRMELRASERGREQSLFARLAVFRGGWTLDAAELVADDDLDTMQSLVDKSLVRHSEDRYWMLETIREYATEGLEASGEANALRERHAAYFLRLVEDAVPQLRDVALARTGAVLGLLEREHDNLRAALDRLGAMGETIGVLQMAGALVEFWFANDHWVELRGRLMDALAADDGRTAARARALIGLPTRSA